MGELIAFPAGERLVRTQLGAVGYIRALIDAGLAGTDLYDDDILLVPVGYDDTRRGMVEIALDTLHAPLLTTGTSYHMKPADQCVRAELRGEARRMLCIDTLGAPRLVQPLASRGAPDPDDPHLAHGADLIQEALDKARSAS